MGATERYLASLPGVQAAVAATADKVAGEARARLAVHTKTGEHHIEVDHSGIDSEVMLVGEAAQSLHYGHQLSGAYAGNNNRGKWVEGTFIMAGLA